MSGRLRHMKRQADAALEQRYAQMEKLHRELIPEALSAAVLYPWLMDHYNEIPVYCDRRPIAHNFPIPHPYILTLSSKETAAAMPIEKVSLPHDCCWVEVLDSEGERILVVRQDSRSLWLHLGLLITDDRAYELIVRNSYEFGVQSICFLEREIVCHMYRQFFEFLKRPRSFSAYEARETPPEWKQGEREPKPQRPLVYVLGKGKQPPSLRGRSGSRVRWTLSAEVMGHWRAHPGIGKDRHGNYVVPGRTWVTPHVRHYSDDAPEPEPRLRVVRA